MHMLTNGRSFADRNMARRIATIGHPDLMLGIPLYSDVDHRHDFVVQAKGAFGETMKGLLNLGREKVPVEIRVVLHRRTYARLPELARYIGRNLPFVSQVALMGLELMGFARTNLDALWIEPPLYMNELRAAVRELADAGLNVSIYNLQLCLLPEDLWPFARKSISDWKNIYLPVCDGCSVKEQCAGFFASSQLRVSSHILPMPFTITSGL